MGTASSRSTTFAAAASCHGSIESAVTKKWPGKLLFLRQIRRQTGRAQRLRGEPRTTYTLPRAILRNAY